MNSNNPDLEEELKEEDLIIQAAATAAISTAFTVLDYSQTYYSRSKNCPNVQLF
jgi:hypothetical protein